MVGSHIILFFSGAYEGYAVQQWEKKYQKWVHTFSEDPIPPNLRLPRPIVEDQLFKCCYS